MKEKTSISQKLQKFGSVLAGMVIPNIGLQMQNLQN